MTSWDRARNVRRDVERLRKVCGVKSTWRLLRSRVMSVHHIAIDLRLCVPTSSQLSSIPRHCQPIDQHEQGSPDRLRAQTKL